jgi:hypothetical protein
MTSFKHISDHVLYVNERFHAAFPSVVETPSGDLLLAFRRARDHRWLVKNVGGTIDPAFDHVDHVDARSTITMQRFDKTLNTLSDVWTLPPDDEAGDQDANLFFDSQGRLYQHGFLWYPATPDYYSEMVDQGLTPYGSIYKTGCIYIPWGAYVRRSDDEGITWSERVFLDNPTGEPSFHGRDGLFIGACRGRMQELADGTIALAGYGGLCQSKRKPTRLFTSDDRGETWSQKSIIATPPSADFNFHEPTLLNLGNNKLIVFHRTAGLEDKLITAKSNDGGESFEEEKIHKLTGHPHDPLLLSDGRLLLVYGYRHEPFGIRCRLIDPEGQDFGETEEFIIKDNHPSPDCGYPWAVELETGRVLVVYYNCSEEGLRQIEGSIIEI